MLDIELNKQLPVITMNFEEVKKSIETAMEKYKYLIVTEEELPGCKATQKQLAGYRNKLDSYRKEVKKEMSKPIDKFEDDCKVLIGLVEDAETPIKAGIEVFNQKVRDKKRLDAEELIKQSITEHQLNKKYASRLVVLDKYTNLSAKAKDVKKDIEEKAFFLIQEQNKEIEMIRIEEERRAEALRAEAERKAEIVAIEKKRQIELATAEVVRKAEAIEIAKSTLISANTDIKAKMQIEDFEPLINNGMSAMNIVKEINKRKARIVISEKPVEKPVEKPIERVIVPQFEEPGEKVFARSENNRPTFEKEVEAPVKEIIQKETEIKVEKVYFIEMRVQGTMDKITALSHFLKNNDYKYEATNKGLLDV